MNSAWENQMRKRAEEIKRFRVEIGDQIRYTNRVGVVWEGTVIAVDKENCKILFQNNIDGDVHWAPWNLYNEIVEVIKPSLAVGSKVRCVPASAGDAWKLQEIEGEIRGWVIGVKGGRILVMDWDGQEYELDDKDWIVISSGERVLEMRRRNTNGKVTYEAAYQASWRSFNFFRPLRKAIVLRLAEEGVPYEDLTFKKAS